MKYQLGWLELELEHPDIADIDVTKAQLCHPLCQCSHCQLYQQVHHSNTNNSSDDDAIFTVGCVTDRKDIGPTETCAVYPQCSLAERRKPRLDQLTQAYLENDRLNGGKL